ncbi:rhamnose mutarotase [Cantharellus anzutake]|uniref:rhamnose mutarotase n=1 Tax=Cantharellus anzutake TaxID=1750568 RepID=UPI00190612C3|nr:rhamnose mutarotase [Cantharellus anzutake]KAF8327867.1 rhamnose mutarotase [Cantharellus anzutake]
MSIKGTDSGRRICQVIELKANSLEEYKKIHAHVWPSVLATLQRAHIVDYSIHFLPTPPYLPNGEREGVDAIAGLLIATFKYVGDNFDEDMKMVAGDADTRRWWGITDRMQNSVIGGATGSRDGPWWFDCDEVFRFEG